MNTEMEKANPVLLWPATSFYWAILEAPGYRRAGPLPPGLVAMLADEIPPPIEDVHAVGTAIGNGRILACAAPRDQLTGIDSAIRILTPSELPPGVELTADTVTRLNLLVGAFEPASIRRERWRRHVARAALVALVATLLTIGLLRRAMHWRAVESQARLAQQQFTAGLFGDGPPPEHALMSLDAELGHLRELARSRPEAPNDASVQLASLLKSWPADTPSNPQSIAVDRSGINVSVSVEGDPAPFLAAFKAPDGWTLDQPRLNSAGLVSRITLRLRPDPLASLAGRGNPP